MLDRRYAANFPERHQCEVRSIVVSEMDTVVATDCASADADHDNGTFFHGASQYGRDDERATRRVDTAKGIRKARPEMCDRGYGFVGIVDNLLPYLDRGLRDGG